MSHTLHSLGGAYLALWQTTSTEARDAGMPHDHFGFVSMHSASGMGSTAVRMKFTHRGFVHDVCTHDAVAAADDAALCYLLLSRPTAHSRRFQQIIRAAPLPRSSGRTCQCYTWAAAVLARLFAEGLLPCRSLQALLDELSMVVTATKTRMRRCAMPPCELAVFGCCKY